MKKYEKYKDSGIEWIGEIPFGWDVIKLKWITPIKRGASPRPIDDLKYFDENGEFSWVRIADVTASERYLVETKEKLSELGATLSVKQYPGDFFLSIAGSVGKPIITKIKCCIHDGFVWFPDLKIDPEFLYYIFQTGLPYSGLGKLGTQLNLNTETIGNIYIPNISDEDIKSIVSFLDKKTALIDEIIAKKERLIETLQAKRQATINEVVTGKKVWDATSNTWTKPSHVKDSGIEWLGEIPEDWEVVKLKYLVSMKSGNFISADLIEETGKYPIYGGNGIRGYYKEFTHEGFYPLIGRQGALCGNINYADGKFWATEHAVVVDKIKDIDLYWMGELLKLMNLNQYSLASAQPGLSVERIINLRIPLPDFQIQLKISNYIQEQTSAIESLISKITLQIEKLKYYRQSLISEAVTGKIDVREWKAR